MKIDDSLTGLSAIRDQKNRIGKRKGPSASDKAGSSQDSIEITSTSAQLSQLEDLLSQMDTDETARLEAVRQAVLEGRFQVDEEVVADALIQSSLDQLRRQNRK